MMLKKKFWISVIALQLWTAVGISAVASGQDLTPRQKLQSQRDAKATELQAKQKQIKGLEESLLVIRSDSTLKADTAKLGVAIRGRQKTLTASEADVAALQNEIAKLEADLKKLPPEKTKEQLDQEAKDAQAKKDQAAKEEQAKKDKAEKDRLAKNQQNKTGNQSQQLQTQSQPQTQGSGKRWSRADMLSDAQRASIVKLVPNSAPGSAQVLTVTANQSRPSLTRQQLLASLGPDANISIEGAPYDTYAVLNGAVPAACLEFLTIEPVLTKTKENGNYIAFNVIDNSEEQLFVDCATDQRLRAASGESIAFVNTSQLTAAKMTLPTALGTSGCVGIKEYRPDNAQNVLNIFDLDNGNTSKKCFTSKEDRIAKEEQLAKEEDAALMKERLSAINNCSRSQSALLSGNEALEALIAEGAFGDPEDEENPKLVELNGLRAKIRQGTVDLWKKDILAATTTEQQRELRASLDEWAKDADKTAGIPPQAVFELYHTLALQETGGENATPQGYSEALKTMRLAQSIPGLSKADIARIKGYDTDIKVERLELISQAGVKNNPMFMPSFQSLYTELQQSTTKACSSAKGTLESCMASMNAMSHLMQMPRQAQAVDTQRTKMMAQLQSIMIAASGGGAGQTGATQDAPLFNRQNMQAGLTGMSGTAVQSSMANPNLVPNLSGQVNPAQQYNQMMGPQQNSSSMQLPNAYWMNGSFNSNS